MMRNFLWFAGRMVRYRAGGIAILAVSVFGLVGSAQAADPLPAAAEKPADGRQKTAPPVARGTAEAAPQALSSKNDKPSTEKASANVPAKKAEKLRFQFRSAPWKDVIEWFAKEEGLSLYIPEGFPQGSFNLSSPHEYTPGEAIDLLNRDLQYKGFALFRTDPQLVLVEVEKEGFPEKLVSTVPLEELDKKGSYEPIRVIFNLSMLRPQDVESEVQKLLGPKGEVKSLAASQQLSVTDYGGRVRDVRDYLKRIDAERGVKIVNLKWIQSEEAMPVLRQLLDIPEGQTAPADNSIRIASDGDRLILSGRPDKVARAAEIIAGLDVPGPAGKRDQNKLQMEFYPLGANDGTTIKNALTLTLAGQADVRFDVDPKTNTLIVFAKPAQQAAIKSIVDRFILGGIRVEVIHLVRVDPLSARDQINKLFGSSDPKQSSANAPQVDADGATHQLSIRGTDIQIQQIRDLLTKMGEPGAGAAQREHVRKFNMSEDSAQEALQRAALLFSTMHPNKIRIVNPSAGNGSNGATGESADPQRDAQPAGGPRKSLPPADTPRMPELKPQEVPKAAPVPKITMTRGTPAFRRNSAEISPPKGGTPTARILCVADPVPERPAADGKAPAPIVVMVGPNGLSITSEDLDALDEFESVLTQVINDLDGPIAVFYLKYAECQSAAQTLDKLLAGGSGVTDTESNDKSTPADKLSSSRRAMVTGPVKITPDQRLNSLLVQANHADLDTIKQLLKIVDRDGPPDPTSVSPKPQMVPVLYAHARDVAEVLREVYADRLVMGQGQEGRGGGGSGGPGSFFQNIMRGMGGDQGGGGGGRGGRGGGGGGESGGGQARRDDTKRISIGVDTRTNTIVIAAVEPLFKEAKQLVEQLDLAAKEKNETVVVVQLHRVSPASIEKALTAFAGEAVQAGGETPTSAAGANPASAMPAWFNQRSSSSRGGEQPGMSGFGGFGRPGGSSGFGGFGQPGGYDSGSGRRSGRGGRGGGQ